MPHESLPKPDVTYLLSVGRHMGRDRYQKGTVEDTGESGAKKAKWKGHFWIYEIQPDGTEKRRHKAVILGPKKALKKWQAEKALEEHIQRLTRQSTGTISISAKEMTVSWFFENRFRPMMEPKWKESSRKETIGNINRYVLKQIGGIPLSAVDKFTLQMHLNKLAETFSESVVEKFMVWSNAILEEALDQDLISKNPARKLEKPQTRKVNKRTVKPEEIHLVMQCLEGTVRTALMISFVLGLRPGELLALRWDDFAAESLRIDEGTRYGKIYPPKTESSIASVWLPAEMKLELDRIRPVGAKPADFVFPNSRGGVYRLDNFRKRKLKPALAAAKEKAKLLGANPASIDGITFQICRRTCGTLMQNHGELKDIQSHLRHRHASTTLGIYVQEIPQNVKAAVQSLYRELFDLGQESGPIQ